MKRKFLSLAFLFLCLGGFAQVDFPVVDTGKIWSIVQLGSDGGGATTTAYKFENDTMINGLTYHQVFECIYDSTLSHWYMYPNYFIREDSLGNVFRFESQEESLIYTFNLEPGDSVFTGYQIGGHDLYAHVDTVDSILIDGDFHKRIVYDPWIVETWIEGIGSIYNTLYPFAHFYTTDHFDLLCVFT